MIDTRLLKVGMKVKIRSDLTTGPCGNNTVIETMLKMRGQVCTVRDIRHTPPQFSLKETGYSWTPEMCECIVDETAPIYKNLKKGDKVRFKSSLCSYGLPPYLLEWAQGKVCTVNQTDGIWFHVIEEHHGVSFHVEMIADIISVDDKVSLLMSTPMFIWPGGIPSARVLANPYSGTYYSQLTDNIRTQVRDYKTNF
jgi:hypothetical protein